MEARNRLAEIGPKRVVIFRALQLGDMLCAVPALRALRAALPDAVITLVGLPWARSFTHRFNYYLDDFIEFPGFPGFPERAPQIQDFPRFLTEVQWLDLDLAIQMQGSGYLSNSLVSLFGARHTAGFYLPGEYRPNDTLFMEYPIHLSEIHRHLSLVEHLGAAANNGDELEFPLYTQDWEEFAALKRKYGLEAGRYVCVHPGARGVTRRWPAERFAALADGLVEQGLQVVLTGVQAEAELTARIAAEMRQPALDLAGKTTLGGLAAMLTNARLLVCNDTGVSHIAAALLTPSVVLFSDSEPERWAPKNHRLHHIVRQAPVVEAGEVLSIAYQMLQEQQHAY